MVNTNLTASVFQIKITLRGTRPPIWRRVLAPSHMSLGDLHRIIQTVMEWQDSHLHMFHIGRATFGDVQNQDLMDGLECADQDKAELSRHLHKGLKFDYTYDYGDDWIHDIVVEKVLAVEPGAIHPGCTGGAMHGPPEDCGGVGGYYEMLEALTDESHALYEDAEEWLGEEFDPKAFSVEEMNERLRDVFPAPKASQAPAH